MISKYISVQTILVLGLLSSSLWAEPNSKYDITYDTCIKKAGTINNSVVYKCSGLVSKMVKQDMNKLYDIIYNNISKQSVNDAKKFESSQRSWLKYRKNHCDLMGSYVGSPMYSYCPMELNKARVLELQVLAGK